MSTEMLHDKARDVDPVTGTATTGHVWDGIRELNTPLPRWWLWIFYATIVWSIGYWIVYPAWPLVTSATNGMFGWNSREAVVSDLDALKAQRGPMVGKLAAASLPEILADAQLLAFARAQGRPAFAENCAPLSWHRGRRREGLSEPERRRLDLGRQDRRDRRNYPPRRPFRRRQGAAGAGHAGVRS